MSENVTAPEVTEPARPRRQWLWPVVGALFIAGLGWLGFDTRNSVNELRGQLATRLADADTYNKQTQAIAGQARQDTKEALAKLSVLENKLAESQNQQVALEALYQELSRNRDEVSLAGIEETLEMASQQLQLAGNVKSALIALQSVDARLARDENKARWVQLRRAINQDMERLKALPYVDTVAISARLDNLIGGVENLPLLSEPVITGESPTLQTNPKSGAFISRFGKELVANLGELVRIRNLEKPDVPLLAPSQSYFLRENLKLRLLNARLALLARNEPSYKADLATAGELLATHFDSKIKAVTTAQATLKQLADSPISIAPPDIADSLKAVRTARLSREKAGK
jgi:uroporphyrin-3 C-methyltransferase